MINVVPKRVEQKKAQIQNARWIMEAICLKKAVALWKIASQTSVAAGLTWTFA